ncbi:hypothetical protein RM543_04955 [Roseicyclus sp. F158]|uniref:GYD domain-containing protein n=1 Tax=Tropicimonas omnivorans TaxID=3075590 RepID=A0ABU3DE86_9RHOB|nr:hypothetical protein [Roseicyclus sp. F158]MDT0682024.1 hypothetical protein [Roseicyclus sp. F158]
MAVEFATPKIPTPHRVVFLGASTEGWFTASGDERRNRILPRMKQMFADWQEMGAKVLATVDDDLFMVGQPGSPDFTWYLIMEVPDLETVAAMINLVRKDEDGVRLDRVMRLEARVGRPFFLLES